MNFNDDDEIKTLVADDVSAGENAETIPEGKTQVTVINNPEAPLDQNNFKVMLELTGNGSASSRPGLDLVTVLDVSGSMGKDNKLDKMKISMEFVINKLSPIDRLSVVVFSSNATRLCRLRQITKESKVEVKNLVFGLNSGGNTDIASGLETALAVLSARRFTQGRTVGIMLMSDGGENVRRAAEVNVSSVPVFTFGFGANHEPKVLTDIALKSAQGTFSDVQKQDDLSVAFAKCLGGLLTVVVEHLELTVKSVKSSITNVTAGNYTQVSRTGSVTVLFGNLYIKEVRTVIVDLRLPAVPARLSADILEISYSYKSPGDPTLFDAAPITVRVRRNGTVVMPERPEMVSAESVMKAAVMMKEARVLADTDKLNEARKRLAEAQNLLQDIETDGDEPNTAIEMMQYEVSELMDMMQSPQVYAKQGRPFALSSETSHGRQRYAARGDVGYLRSFATPRMEKYAEQVLAFEEDPSKPVPTEEEDVKEELAADPLAPIAGALSYYIQNAISSLQAIDRILKKPLKLA